MKHIYLPIPEYDKDIYSRIILTEINNDEVKIIYNYRNDYVVQIPIYDTTSLTRIVSELIERSYNEGFKNGQESIKPE